VLPVGLKACWSRYMSGGIDNKIHLRTMIFSVSLLMSGVTDIGRKSEKPVGLGTLGTSVTKVWSQQDGEQLTMCATISANSYEQSRSNHAGIPSHPDAGNLILLSKLILIY